MKRRLQMGLAAIAMIWALTGAANAQVPVVINEVVYDSPGTDVDTWLELKGTPGMSLDGWEVIGCNGNGGVEYQQILLTGFSIPADGYFLIAENPGMPGADLVTSSVDYQNGPDSIKLKQNGAVIDAVGYEVHGVNDVFCGEGSPATEQIPGPPVQSLARCPDGSDTQDNSVDFVLDASPTPGAANDANCTPPGPEPHTICEIAADDLDGVPVLQGTLIVTEGIAIVASGTWSPTIQEFQLTDDGCCVAVFGGAVNPVVQIGDQVRVEGTVTHFNGRTEIAAPGLVVTVLTSGNPIDPPLEISSFELSVNGENYESCLIQLNCVNIVGGDAWPADGLNANVTVDDGSGPTTMRIDKDTNIDGTAEPTGAFTVIGIGGQFDSSAPYADGYQILPRSLDDLLFDVCEPPTGACCFPDGTCSITTMDDCGQSGGVYQGDDSTCEPNTCPPPTGACCLPPLPDCLIVSQAECDSLGGIYQGNFVPCDPNPCLPVVGACCLVTGECFVGTAEECAASQGEYQGDGTVCTPDLCPPPVPTQSTTWGRIKDRYR